MCASDHHFYELWDICRMENESLGLKNLKEEKQVPPEGAAQPTWLEAFRDSIYICEFPRRAPPN